ncbi:MAG: ATP-binding protein, partial [Bacteroidales bacterium]|nr:ATP-binding protein [Bacteroidales bacterium]
ILCQNIGTVVLVGASSKIKPLELKADIHSIDKPKADSKIADVVKLKESDKPLQLPENKTLADQQTELKNSLLASFHYFKSAALDEISAYNDSTLDKIKKAIHDTAKKIQQINQDTNSYERAKTLLKIKQNMLNTIGNLLIQYRDQQLGQQKELIESELSGLIETTQNLIDHQDNHITIFISAEALKAKPKDPLKVRSAKFKKRLLYKITGKQPSVKIPYKELIKQSFPLTTQKALNIILEKWGIISGQFIVELQNTIEKLDNNFKGFIEADAQNHSSEEELKTRLLKDVLDKIKSLKTSQHKSVENLIPFAQEIIFDSLNDISKQLDDYYSLKGATTDHSNNKDLRRRLRWLAGIPAKWKRNQELFFNSAILDTYLLTFSTRIQTIFNDISYETELKLKDRIEKKQQIILDQVNDLLMHKPESNLQMEENLDFDSDSSYYNFFRTILDSASKRIRLGSRLFPNGITLMTEGSFNEFHERQYSGINTARLSVSRLMDYLIQNELIAPLQDLTQKVPVKIIQYNKIIREEVRLLDFTLSEKQNKFSDEYISDFIYKRSQKIKDTIEKTQILTNETLLKLRERISSFSNNLQFAVFSHKAFHSRQYILNHERKRRDIHFRKFLYKTWQQLMITVSKFYYRRSNSILRAKLLKQNKQKETTEAEDILNIIEASEGNSDVINSLPFYYRQLFLRKQNYLMDFSVGREKELEKAKKALTRYQFGYKGSILILGERYSGKTFLAQHIINKLMYKSNFILIYPPHAGSVNRNDFKQTLISATDKSGEYDDIFSDLPANSIILFEDIDLWWERTVDGMEIISLIMKLIQRYANRYMFLVTANKHTFYLINKIQKIEHQFLSMIDCEPMNARDLGKAIMLRHESGSLKFKLGRQSENQIKPWVKARLFSNYFTYSRGNIGIALRSWIQNITHFGNGIIQIKEPHKPDLEKINNLETDWYIAIVQIILHRRVTVEKFSRIMRIHRQQAIKQIEALYLAGILIEQGKKVYEVNPLIYPHLIDKLTELKII